MKITIMGSPKEIKKLLSAIGGSKEQLNKIASDTDYLRNRFPPFDLKEQIRRCRDIAES